MEHSHQKNTNEKESVLKNVIELTDSKDLLECMLEIRKNRGTNLADQEAEITAAKRVLDENIENANKNDQPLFFYAIRNDANQIVGTAKLTIYNKGSEKRAHLARLTVKPEYRGKGLASILTEKTIQVALAHNCEVMDAEVDILNPPALISRLHDDFVIIDLNLELDEDGERCFSTIKKLKKEPIGYDNKKGSLDELREISLAEAEQIQNLLRNGWVGIDLKNLEGRDDRDPNKWILILEKLEK